MQGKRKLYIIKQDWSYNIVKLRYTPTGFRATDANSGSYLKAVVQLSIITQSILTSLYSATSSGRSAGEMQRDMVHLVYS